MKKNNLKSKINIKNYNKIYHFDNLTDLAEFYEQDIFLSDLKKMIGLNKIILDLGCGYCEYSMYFSYGTNNKIICLDKDENNLKIGKQFSNKNRIKNVKFKNLKFEKGSLNNQRFDLIWCKNMIEYINNPYEVFEYITSICKTGGFIVIGVKFKIIPLLKSLIGFQIADNQINHVKIDKLIKLFKKQKVDLICSIPDFNLDGFYIGIDNVFCNKAGTFFRRFFAKFLLIFKKHDTIYLVGKKADI